jgi:hypothetical protein
VRQLRRKSDLVGALLVLHASALIAGIMARLGNLWRREKGPLTVNLALFRGLAAAGYW